MCFSILKTPYITYLMFTLTHSTCEPDDIQLSSDLINMPKTRLPDQLTYTKDALEYTGVIVTPKYFTATAYVEYLKDNIDKIQFKNLHAVYELVNIPMTQVIREATLTDLKRELDAAKAEIKELREAIETLSSDGYECIHTHEYPSWPTYEEFKRLPGYKYFEAFDNYKSHTIEQKIKLTDGTEREFQFINIPDDGEYVLDTFNVNEIQNLNHILLVADHTHTVYADNIFTQSFIDQYKYFSYTKKLRRIEKNIENKNEYLKYTELDSDARYYNNYFKSNVKNTYIPEFLFSQSIKNFIYNHGQLTKPLFEYIKCFVVGYFLLNPKKFISCKSYILINIKENIVTINIYTSKKNFYFVGYLGQIGLPLIEKVIFNGMEIFF